jgi:hypothetical protein
MNHKIRDAKTAFVVLRHSNHPTMQNHYDILLEDYPGENLDEVALTKLETTSELDQTKLLVSFQGKIRRKYLQYEGLMSDDRGSVKRVDQGTYRIDNHDCIEFKGENLKGTYLLETVNKDVSGFQKSVSLIRL